MNDQRDHSDDIRSIFDAASRGDAEAQNELGNRYYIGDGVRQDYAEAAIWYRRAAEQGDQFAQYSLGNCYYNGYGVRQDHAEAVIWYSKAAEQGNEFAQFDLGGCYFKGVGVKKSYTEAVRWWEEAAEQGYAAAQNILGMCYSDGVGVEQDHAEAVRWFSKAVEQGYEDAKTHLIEMGVGVRESGTDKPLDYMGYYRYTYPDLMPGELRRGDAHFTNSLRLYFAGCKRFGWDERDTDGFGQRRPMYAGDATREHYAVWCSCNSDLTMSAGELSERGIQNHIGDRYIEERVRDPQSHSLGQDKPDEIRVTFVRIRYPGKPGFIYMFYGIIQCVNIRYVDDYMIRTFKLISDTYPDPGLGPKD